MEGGDRGRLTRLALGEAARGLRGVGAAAWRRAALLRAPLPSRVLIAPHDLRTSDPVTATDIYAGRFIFAGQAVQTAGGSPFAVPPPSAAWGQALYGFGWLRHLRAADTVLARQNARALIDEFLDHPPADRRLARAPAVLARRLISFLAASPLVLEGADHAFYQRYLRAVGRAVRALEVDVARGLRPVDRLDALVALAYAGLCCDGLDGVLRRATRGLEQELARQILPDGGHASRSPRLLVELLLDLLPLRQTYAGRRIDPPMALIGAIDRALPALRLFRFGDGSLAHHNGMGASAADHVATLLVYDQARGQAPRHAPYAGYERLEVGGTVLVADVGPPPPLPLSAEAHAGCLSFELSSGAQRIVVNCGAPRGPARMVQAARQTGAHSTATLADASSSRFLDPGTAAERWLLRRLGRVIVDGPRAVEAVRDGAGFVGARHDGYRGRLGLVHERRWRLDADGSLSGEDLFHADPGARPAEAVIRFHLHPAVRAEEAEDGVLLTLANGERWRFSAGGAGLRLEESVFFAAPEGARRTEQIVLATTSEGGGVRWSFERLTQVNGSQADAALAEAGQPG